MCRYSDTLDRLIARCDVNKQSAYTTGNVAKILSVSVNTVLVMCDKWEPIGKDGLECYYAGTHRRIPHHSIIEYIHKHNHYDKLGQ